MKKTWTKVLAVICAAAMVLSFAACSKKGTDETTTGTTETTAAGETTTGDATQAGETTTDAGTTKEGETTTAGSTKKGETAPKPVAGGTYQNTSDKAVVVNAYKTAARNSSKLVKSQNLSIKYANMDGKELPGGILKVVNPVVKKISSTQLDPGIPGNWEKLTANDLSSASMSVNGTTATITMNPKTQKDGKSGEWGAGPVGHAIGVLKGIGEVINVIPGSSQASDGTATLTYENAQVKVTIDTKTNKITSGTAKYTVVAKATKVSLLVFKDRTVDAAVNYDIKLG